VTFELLGSPILPHEGYSGNALCAIS